MTAFEIPLTNEPQTFTINIKNGTYRFTVVYNHVAQCWMVDAHDVLTDQPVVHGIPLITGTDLLGQFQHMVTMGKFVVQSDIDPDEVPTFESLGTRGHLYFVPNP